MDTSRLEDLGLEGKALMNPNAKKP